MTDASRHTQVLLLMKAEGNRKVVGELLVEHGYGSISVQSEQDLQSALALPGPKMALVDSAGYGQGIWDLCERLRSGEIPFLVMSTPQTMRVSSNALALGAISVIQKPVAKAALLQLLNSLTTRSESGHD